MKKTITGLVLSFLILVSSNAYAVQGKREASFIQNMKEQLYNAQSNVLKEISNSTDGELLEKYGDVILELIHLDALIVGATGMSMKKGIRENSELLFSLSATDFIIRNIEEKINELGSLSKYKEAVRKNEKILNTNNKGFFRSIGKGLKVLGFVAALPVILPLMYLSMLTDPK